MSSSTCFIRFFFFALCVCQMRSPTVREAYGTDVFIAIEILCLSVVSNSDTDRNSSLCIYSVSTQHENFCAYRFFVISVRAKKKKNHVRDDNVVETRSQQLITFEQEYRELEFIELTECLCINKGDGFRMIRYTGLGDFMRHTHTHIVPDAVGMYVVQKSPSGNSFIYTNVTTNHISVADGMA